MIFHTACDSIYYEKFYTLYLNSIKHYYPNDKLSLHYVGTNLSDNSNIDILSNENISATQIQEKYKAVIDREVKGYYALARWRTMPVLDEHVVVSDLDVIALKTIPADVIEDIFKDYEIINATRIKPDGISEGGMNLMIIRKDKVESVNRKAQEVLETTKLKWDSDVDVRTYIYKNYKVKEIPEMHVFNKKSDYNTLDKINRSFAVYKGKIDAKFNSLSNASRNIL